MAAVLIFVTAYTPLFASLNGTLAAAQAIQNTTFTYYYDNNGNVIQATDPSKRDSTFTYDALNRRKSSVLPQASPNYGTPSASYTYDGLDQLSTFRDFNGLATNYTRDGLGDNTGLASPETGITAQTFDEAGNLVSSTDARGKRTRYRYDALDRVTNIDYASGTPTILEYDGGASATQEAIGHLTKMADESGNTVFNFDAAGRLLNKVQTVSLPSSALHRTVSYAYDAQGRLESLTYPSGNRVGYTYDASGQVSTISLVASAVSGSGFTAAALLTQITYAPFGPVKGWQWGSGSTAAPNSYTRTFDLDGRLTSYPLGSMAGANTGLLRTLSYDPNSNITSATHTGPANAASLNQTYAYDPLNRLTSFVTPAATQTYAYDLNGNRTNLAFGAVNYPYVSSASSNRLTSTQGPLPAKRNTYDAAGNLTSDGTISYTYSDRGRLASITNGSVSMGYRYNGAGQRVLKSGPTLPGGAVIYAYDENGRLLGEYDASGAALQETVFLGDLPVAVLKPSPDGAATSIYHVYADQINTPRVIEDPATATALWRWDTADPYGAAHPDDNPAGRGNFAYNPRFPGQVIDAETNNHYNYYRDYDPQTGRYVQSDPMGLLAGMNTFAYVGGNPLSNYDPYGLFGVADMPTLPNGLVDFLAGFGDSMSFGITGYVRAGLDIGSVDKCSGHYRSGEAADLIFETGTLGVSAGLKALAAGTSRSAARNGTRRFINAYREAGSLEGGFVHHSNPLFGHPGGMPTMFPTGGLPSAINSASWNLRWFPNSATHSAAHRWMRALEKGWSKLVNPGMAAGRAALDVADVCTCR